MPMVVKELKDAGLSARDAWEIWQQGFESVDKGVRPHDMGADKEAAFVQYIREKIHLMKRRQASGRLDSSTGFLLEAIRHNYANPAFAEEQQQEQAQQKVRGEKARARERETLAEKKTALENALTRDLRARCRQLLTPELAEQALAAVLAEQPELKQWHLPGKTALQNYREASALWIEIDRYVEQHYPERFADLHAAHAPQLAALDAKLAALEPLG
jgi:hypothetical protein